MKNARAKTDKIIFEIATFSFPLFKLEFVLQQFIYA